MHAFLRLIFILLYRHAMRRFKMTSFDETAASYILNSQHTTQDALTIQDVTTLPKLFKWQAQRRCNATLFSFRTQPDADLTTVSYAESYETSPQLANCLYRLHKSSSIENPVVGIWPFLAWVFRLLGVQMGARTTLLSNDITERDMVTIGDEAVINRHAGPQTHLFEDRVMKIGRIDVEAHGCMKAYSICLPNSRIAAYGQLGCLSLVMKGETVPDKEAWEGAQIAPRRTQI
jgi:hypothetical protein